MAAKKTKYRSSKGGYVYVFENPSLPGTLKMGFARKKPDSRAKELSGTSIPKNYVVTYYVYAVDCAEPESTVYKNVVQYRLNPKREFFEIDLQTLRNVIDSEIPILRRMEQKKISLGLAAPIMVTLYQAFDPEEVQEVSLDLAYDVTEDEIDLINCFLNDCYDQGIDPTAS